MLRLIGFASRLRNTSYSHQSGKSGWMISVQRLLPPSGLAHLLIVSLRMLTVNPQRRKQLAKERRLASPQSPRDLLDNQLFLKVDIRLFTTDRLSRTHSTPPCVFFAAAGR